MSSSVRLVFELEDGNSEDEENGTEDEEDGMEDEEETDGTDAFFFFCIAFHWPLHLFHSFAKL